MNPERTPRPLGPCPAPEILAAYSVEKNCPRRKWA
jgi:hypothetical protein